MHGDQLTASKPNFYNLCSPRLLWYIYIPSQAVNRDWCNNAIASAVSFCRVLATGHLPDLQLCEAKDNDYFRGTLPNPCSS